MDKILSGALSLIFLANVGAMAVAADLPYKHSSGEPSTSGSKQADADTLKLVKFFLKTPTANLPPEAVGAFMAVDPTTLPAKLRGQYSVKKEELLALKKVADGQRKPIIRRLGMDAPPAKACEPDRPDAGQVLKLAGYGQIGEDDERFLMDKTKCSECELIVEFTLRVVEREPEKKGEKPKLLYFLHEKDPLQNLVAAHHSGVKNPFGTQFFGIGAPSCH